MSLAERLKSFLESGKGWERRKTSVPGVFLIKLPEGRGRPASLAVEVNPVDSTGQTRKKRGLVLRSSAELEEFRRLLSDDKLSVLMSEVDRVNPSREKEGDEEALEV